MNTVDSIIKYNDVENRKYTKFELIKEFEHFISHNNYRVLKWVSFARAPYKVVISNEINEFYLTVYLKNISGSGWKDKPHIKRVQVTNIRHISPENFKVTTKDKTILILGLFSFNNNFIMVAWDAYKYVLHRTLRSCYITLDNIFQGFEKGYVETIDLSRKVWIFTPKYFEKFLLNYINYKKVE